MVENTTIDYNKMGVASRLERRRKAECRTVEVIDDENWSSFCD